MVLGMEEGSRLGMEEGLKQRAVGERVVAGPVDVGQEVVGWLVVQTQWAAPPQIPVAWGWGETLVARRGTILVGMNPACFQKHLEDR